MASKMLESALTSLDMYGHPIGVHYNGDSMFRTRLGAIVSVFTYALIILNFVDLVA